MNWDSIKTALEPYTTDNIIAKLVEWDLLNNWYFIGGVILAAVICHLLKQPLLTALIVMLSGIAVLTSYTFGIDSASEGIVGEKLILFIATGMCIVGAIIYLLFIRND